MSQNRHRLATIYDNSCEYCGKKNQNFSYQAYCNEICQRKHEQRLKHKEKYKELKIRVKELEIQIDELEKRIDTKRIEKLEEKVEYLMGHIGTEMIHHT